MAGIYDRQIAMAQSLIAKYGQTVTWRKSAVLTPDPNKPWEMVPGAATDYNPKMVFISKFKEHQFLKYIPGTEIPDGLFVGIMPAVSFVPAINDTIIRGSETLTIEKIDEVAPNGTPIVYFVTVKR